MSLSFSFSFVCSVDADVDVVVVVELLITPSCAVFTDAAVPTDDDAGDPGTEGKGAEAEVEAVTEGAGVVLAAACSYDSCNLAGVLPIDVGDRDRCFESCEADLFSFASLAACFRFSAAISIAVSGEGAREGGEDFERCWMIAREDGIAGG